MTDMFTVTERDSSGAVTASYVANTSSPLSDRGAGKDTPETRVDVIEPKESRSYTRQIVDIFLPAGYPASVSEDYISYQFYDSLQAFSSSIAGLLASRAVLQGVGVGDASASPTAALLLTILQESTGRLATILFAHKLGTALEPECKMYRLIADIFNDLAMVLDCLSPAFPKPFRVGILSISSVLRALCGVCAGSAKASLSAHFAVRGNLGEVNAKDSSQETVISMLGMLAGSVVVSWVSSPMATWSTLIGLLSVHLAMNYAAVTAVSMRSLNRQRANIVFSAALQDGVILTPAEVSQQERIFERDGMLRWTHGCCIGHCEIGAPLSSILKAVGRRHDRTGSIRVQATVLSEILQLFDDDAYMLWFAESEATIVLKAECGPTDQLRAWMHALLVAQRAKAGTKKKPKDDSQDSRLTELRETKVEIEAQFAHLVEKLRSVGWDLDVAFLETRAGTRVSVQSNGEKHGRNESI
ncbi:DUF647-domain-containing protein [Sporormia fimetaria CBS 119925]|uniref:DUF647-domain-containing protein n=1 Tax=Sporormia fimetaria CBS 119925 TaxID=1340428 RepID=A0A6A6UYC9_9PLEO|nr:DUF647-domain-containing protein [Sporormia fimetaria CBS 119925]